jgi:hypothetical protein
MGARSDVCIAIKKDLHNKLSEDVKKLLNDDSDEVLSVDGDVLYILRGVNWNSGREDVGEIYAQFDKFDPEGESYFLQEGCHNYPDESECRGEWVNNPWNLDLMVNVEVRYEQIGDDIKD